MSFTSYAIVGFAIIMLASVRQADKFEDFCVGFFTVLFSLAIPLPLALGIRLSPHTIDAVLPSVDLALGLDGFAIARHLTWGRGLLAGTFYNPLPIAFAVAWTISRSRTLIRSVVIAALLALPLFFLFPAVGPMFAYRGWPEASATLMTSTCRTCPRNCVPSLHFAWTLLFSMNAPTRAWRILFGAYCVGVGVATVALGQHYFVDLVVAVPFALVVQWVAEQWPAWAAQSSGRQKAESTDAV